MPCMKCGLKHDPEQLFVETGRDDIGPLLTETCSLEPAWQQAHAQTQPLGAVAYHATHAYERVLRDGLEPSGSPCRHICLAARPEVAVDITHAPVIAVDVSGLDLFFELGEARCHERIDAWRLSLLDPQPVRDPDRRGWSDPAWRRNHTDCLAVMGLPFSRQLLRDAEHETKRRWLSYTSEQFKSVVDELLRS